MCDRKNGYYKELLKEMSKKDLSEEVKSTLDKLKAEAGGFDSAGLGEASKYSKTTYKVNNFKEILDIV